MFSLQQRRPRPLPVVAAAVVVLLAGVLAGSAPSAADESPAPTAPAESVAPLSDAPAPAPVTGGDQATSDGSADDDDAAESGGGVLPGERPGENAAESTSDAAPSLDPGYVDRYSVLWRVVQRDQHRIEVLSKDIAAARRVLRASQDDLATTLRQRGRADAQLAVAAEQFTLAVHDLYITGSTDLDLLINVLGSHPDDLLANLDSLMYLRSATGTESLDLLAAQEHSTLVDSAASNAQLRSQAELAHVASVAKDLAAAKRMLRKDNDELQRLIAAAAPQTVVGKDGCPKAVLDGTVPVDIPVRKLCRKAVKAAATPQAAVAIKWALIRLGAPYACGGIGRLDAWRYDCSSYVSRAYAEGAGLGTAGTGWAPSTRNMVPWDGVPLDPHYAPIPASKLKPGDLVLYDTCPTGDVCPYRHVVMYLGAIEPGGVPMMAHTNSCGDVAHVEPFWGTDAANYLGSRRVMALPGERLQQNLPTDHRPTSG